MIDIINSLSISAVSSCSVQFKASKISTVCRPKDFLYGSYRHFTLSLTFLLSSLAKEERTVSISSPSPDNVDIFSFSNQISTPIFFNSLTTSSITVVFLANLKIDFVRITSISPCLASSSIF